MAICLRSSAGSLPSFSAILSSWTSTAKRGWVEPWPRLGPQAGLLVYSRMLSKRKLSVLYVVGIRQPV